MAPTNYLVLAEPVAHTPGADTASLWSALSSATSLFRRSPSEGASQTHHSGYTDWNKRDPKDGDPYDVSSIIAPPGFTIGGDSGSTASRPHTELGTEVAESDNDSTFTSNAGDTATQKDCPAPADSMTPGCEHVKTVMENPITFEELVDKLHESDTLEKRKGGGGKGGGGSKGGGSGGGPSKTAPKNNGGSGNGGSGSGSGSGGYGYSSSGTEGVDSTSGDTGDEGRNRKIYIGASVAGGYVVLLLIGTVVFCAIATREQKDELKDVLLGLSAACLEATGKICCGWC